MHPSSTTSSFALPLHLSFFLLLLIIGTVAQTETTTTTSAPDDDEYDVNYRNNCLLTGQPPQPAAYEFRMCHFYEESTCCFLGHDHEIYNAFQGLIDVGESCPYKKRKRAPELHQWYCFGCHPRMMDYIHPTEDIVYVCEDFAERLWALVNGSKIPQCALRVLTRECDGGWDDCGDDVIVPTVEFNGPEEFLNGVDPGFIWEFVQFEFKVVKDADEAREMGARDCYNAASGQVVEWIMVLLGVAFVQYFLLL